MSEKWSAAVLQTSRSTWKIQNRWKVFERLRLVASDTAARRYFSDML